VPDWVLRYLSDPQIVAAMIGGFFTVVAALLGVWWTATQTPAARRASTAKARQRKAQTPTAPSQAEMRAKRLRDFIYSLENHHTNPDGIFWIGQTLVELDSFLADEPRAERAQELVGKLMRDIDEQMDASDVLFAVIVRPSDISELVRELKKLLA
jgi:hypothetical protein